MELLKKMKLAKYERTGKIDPALQIRIKLMIKIDEQINLITNPKTELAETVVLKDADGKDKQVNVEKRVLRWWQIGMNGKIKLTVRYGSRPLQFAKGFDAIEVAGTNEWYMCWRSLERRLREVSWMN